MPPTVEIARDYSMLRKHAANYLRALGGPAHAASEVPAAYGEWIGYLFSLRTALECGAKPRLAADVVPGLRILEAALQEYSRAAKRCKRCGGVTISDFICEHCGQKL